MSLSKVVVLGSVEFLVLAELTYAFAVSYWLAKLGWSMMTSTGKGHLCSIWSLNPQQASLGLCIWQ